MIKRSYQSVEEAHLARLRELERRQNAAQTTEVEENIQRLIDAENIKWETWETYKHEHEPKSAS